MVSFRVLFLAAVVVLISSVGPSAARHPHDDEQIDAILRLLGEADDALAQSRDVLRKSPDLTVEGSPIAPVRDSIERTAAEMRTLRTAIHVAFEHPRIHENIRALGSVQKVAREMARMSVALRTMSNEAVQVAKRTK